MKVSYLESILSSIKFDDLVVLSSILSLIEVNEKFPDGDFLYTPQVNNVKNNILTKSIFNSHSHYLSPKDLSLDTFILIYNKAAALGDNSELLERRDISDEEKLKLYMSFMLTSQSAFTQNPISKIAISKYIFDLYPKKYENELKEKFKYNYFNINQCISKNLGISFNTFILISIFIGFIDPKLKYDKYFTPINKNDLVNLAKKNDPIFNEIQQKIILRHVVRIKEYYAKLVFSIKPLIFKTQVVSNLLPFVDYETFESYFNLTAAKLNEVRKSQLKKEFNIGHLAQQITPLLRKPILKLDIPAYIVPNYRYFQSSISEIIRLALNEDIDNKGLNETLGFLQEKLIQEISKELESSVIILDEQVYIKNNSEFRGPDLLIVDDGRPILIESKLSQLRVTTRINPYGDNLDSQLNNLYTAVCKLEEKYHDLYDHSHYTFLKSNLRPRESIEPVFVGIVYQGVEVMQEQIRENKEKNVNHPLANLNYPHVFLDLETYLRAVEICKSHNIGLYDLLLEYWEIGNITTAKKYSADSFKMRSYNNKNSFTRRVYDDLISAISS